jgi:lipopolysaccharide/colanic/teichoic acid biosynthesis glycosyltransferase
LRDETEPTDQPDALFWRHVVKRALDLILGCLFLVLSSPVLLLVALLVRLTSPGPALFRQVRVGERGSTFQMYKFRTMRVGCSDQAHRDYVVRLLKDPQSAAAAARAGLYKLADDQRVTRLGVVLRKTSLDELPQLINVMRGEMSLVGPRPMLPWEVDLLGPVHRKRLDVPAGITGLWQVSGRNRLTMTDALDLDVEYVRRACLTLDLWILLRTAFVVLIPNGDAR